MFPPDPATSKLCDRLFGPNGYVLDRIAGRYTAIGNFADLVDAEGGYRPSIYCNDTDDVGEPDRGVVTFSPLADLRLLAAAYDTLQAARGDPRRVFPDRQRATVDAETFAVAANRRLRPGAWVRCVGREPGVDGPDDLGGFGELPRGARGKILRITPADNGDRFRWNLWLDTGGARGIGTTGSFVPAELVEHCLPPFTPGQQIHVFVNQSSRVARVLARLLPEGNAALVEYEMPAGTTGLAVARQVQKAPGEWSAKVFTVGYGALRAEWRAALNAPDAVPWRGRGQTRGQTFHTDNAGRTARDCHAADAEGFRCVAYEARRQDEPGFVVVPCVGRRGEWTWAGVPWPFPPKAPRAAGAKAAGRRS